jgi:hypothetical protein
MGDMQEICQKLSDLHHDGGIEEAKPIVSRSSHSPIRSLPVEILCRIFRMCSPDNHFKRPTQSSAPLILSRVCKDWKDIAWNEPSLWTRPRVWFPPGWIKTASRLFRSTLEVYQKRSKDADFNLSVDQTCKIIGISWKDDLKALSDTLPRCRELWISCQESDWLVQFNLLNPPVLNQLEYFFLKIHTPYGRYRMKNAPRLRTVRLYVITPGILEYLSLPYNQLLDLSCVLGRIDASDTTSSAINAWRSFIVKCPNLRVIEAYFQGWGCSDLSGLNPSSINNSLSARFDHVRKVIMRVGFRADLASILKGFSFPMIEELHLIATSNPISFISPDVSFFEGLNTTLSYVSRLTSLRLIRVSVTSSELQVLLQATPLITSLDIMLGVFHHASFEVEDENLRLLLTIHTVSNELHPVIPRLRHLRLYLKVNEDISQVDNAAQYAILARSRYWWMSKHANTDEDPQILKAFPSYPFRLYLKYETNGKDMIHAVAEAIGPTAYPVLWPERSNCFLKEQ